MRPFFRLRDALATLSVLFATVAAAAAAAPACKGGNVLDALRAGEPAHYEALLADAARVENGEGLLWRVEKPGLAPSYLFGTIHLTDPRVIDLPGPVHEALAKSKTLVIENLDTLDQSSLPQKMSAHANLMVFTDGTRLTQHMNGEQREAVAAALALAGGRMDAVDTMKPWILSVMLAAPACEEARRQEIDVVDTQLAHLAQKAGLKLVGLESLREQLSAFAEIPIELQVEYLVSTARMASQAEDFMFTLAALYTERKVGLMREMARFYGLRTGISQRGYAAFNGSLVEQRNQRMAERAAPLLQAGGVMVGVGALHLVGETGLVHLLRARGYEVTRVY